VVLAGTEVIRADELLIKEGPRGGAITGVETETTEGLRRPGGI